MVNFYVFNSLWNELTYSANGKKIFWFIFSFGWLDTFSTYQVQSNDNESHTAATRAKEINPNVSREKSERFRLNFLLYLLMMVMMLLKKYKKNLKVWCSKSSFIYDSMFFFFCSSLHLNIFSFCQCNAVMGNCLFAYGRKLGELCRRDADCESGLICDLSAVSGASVCRAPMAVAKQYAEDCLTSSDCDITRYVRLSCYHFYFLFANG